ncbi:hypothetical protein B0J18DRAFT_486879 [Chaetomium sp. MPI-SDFR-AT-0129]|nr:hypothetical protein B0J18DRAFT_486879 [Chaetomium sp. MPI-SDFR-AT-0129]
MDHIPDIINHLTHNRLGDAFESILDLGDAMHDMPDPFHAVSDLHQVTELFACIAHHAAYGIYQGVDDVLHRLLILAIRRCADLKTKAQSGRSGRNTGEHGEGPAVWWLSPGECEADDLLEVCRNFFHYVAGHPEVGSAIEDPCLMSARDLLQRLCPRINGLSHWSRPAAGGDAKTEAETTTCGRTGEKDHSVFAYASDAER